MSTRWLWVACIALAGCAPAAGGAGEGEGEGEPAPLTCQARCDDDDDCFSPARCVDGRCVNPPFVQPCLSDAECAGYANQFFWSVACVAASDCGEDEACVDVDGLTFVCALRANDACDGPTLVDVNGDDVVVCGSVSVCIEGACAGCRDDDDCSKGFSTSTPHCRADDACVACLEDSDCPSDAPACYQQQYCGCGDDDDCFAQGGGRCDFFGQCFGCRVDADCEFFSNGTVCLEEAICGCRDVADCPTEPAAGTLVCEPLR